MESGTIIEHYGHRGRILRFENREDLFPVNRDQSLLMASNALTEALDYAGRSAKPLEELRAVEICCGGGPAAIVLKDAGVGFVEASDLNPLALEMTRRNAALNGLTLDRLVVRDLLGLPRRAEECFDLVVCNPPCARRIQLTEPISPHMRMAVDGGLDGVDIVLSLIVSARQHLVPGGCLIFMLTSSMDFRQVIHMLDGEFRGNWRLAYATPVAQPYVDKSRSWADSVAELVEERRIFVWEGEDGWLWRLAWIIVATNLPTRKGAPLGRLWFHPYGCNIAATSYWETLPHFEHG
jgi:methylase of polypeptide subunit release factors